MPNVKRWECETRQKMVRLAPRLWVRPPRKSKECAIHRIGFALGGDAALDITEGWLEWAGDALRAIRRIAPIRLSRVGRARHCVHDRDHLCAQREETSVAHERGLDVDALVVGAHGAHEECEGVRGARRCETLAHKVVTRLGRVRTDTPGYCSRISKRSEIVQEIGLTSLGVDWDELRPRPDLIAHELTTARVRLRAHVKHRDPEGLLTHTYILVGSEPSTAHSGAAVGVF